MSTYLMTLNGYPFAAHMGALDLNPDMLTFVDATLERETEADVRATVAAHWVVQDRTYARYIMELVQEIRKTNELVGIEDARSDDRIIAIMLKNADLLERPAPDNWITHSTAMLAFFRMYARTSSHASRLRQSFLSNAPHDVSN